MLSSAVSLALSLLQLIGAESQPTIATSVLQSLVFLLLLLVPAVVFSFFFFADFEPRGRPLLVCVQVSFFLHSRHDCNARTKCSYHSTRR